MARTDPQLNLRLPVELKEELEAAAARNNRTTTAETVERLRQSFQSTPDALLAVITKSELRAAKAEFMQASFVRLTALLARPAQVLASYVEKIPNKSSVVEATLPGLKAAIDAATVMIGKDIFDGKKLSSSNIEKYEELMKLEKQAEELSKRQNEVFDSELRED